MLKKQYNERHVEALVRLIDDDSPLVRRVILEEFRKLGKPGLDKLSELIKGRNRILAAHSRDLLLSLQGPDPITAMTQFIRSLNYDLESGCLLLERVIDPESDHAESCLTLEAMASRCRDLLMEPSNSREQCRVLNRVIFQEYGFRGENDNFDDPMYNFLGPVLRLRRGIPITLSIIYLLVSLRCNVALEPVGLPGRFVVGCYDSPEPFFIDCFEGGSFRDSNDLRIMLTSNNIRPKTNYLMPISVSDVLIRCCRNIIRSYSLENDFKRARLFAAFIHEFERIFERHTQP